MQQHVGRSDAFVALDHAPGNAIMSSSSSDGRQRCGLDVFRTLPGDLAPRDVQDLMTYPFFSLAKSKRTIPIDYHSGDVTIRVEGTHEHGLATIWDADILIWAASQIVEARDHSLRTSRFMTATPYQILTFIGRGTSSRDYLRLKAALDRLQSTTVATSLRQLNSRRLHRFSWINEWKEHSNGVDDPCGIEIVLADWFYSALITDGLVLTIDRAYFDLTGGIERWLYRLVRKHGGKQPHGWRFDFRHLYFKSGSVARYANFAMDLRCIVQRQALPGYLLGIERMCDGSEWLKFSPRQREPVTTTIRSLADQMRFGDKL